MSTLTFPVGLLLCPKCSGKLQMLLYTFDPHYGILRCDCGEMPIVHSIPILKDFPGCDEVLSIIKDRRAKDALILTLGTFARHKNFERKGPHDPRTKAGQARLHDLIDNPLMTAQQFLTAIVPPDEAEAIFYRPANPAFMAGICLAGLVPGRGYLLLHVGCGAGHLARALSNRHQPETLFNVDADFTLLYAARRFMSEDAQFVCADPGEKLPFRNDAVMAAIVEPHSFGENEGKEIDRVVDPGGLILGTCFEDPKEFLNQFSNRGGRAFSIDNLAMQFVKDRTFDASAREKPNGTAAVVVARDLAAFRPIDLEDLLGCKMPRPNPVYNLEDKGDILAAKRRTEIPDAVIPPGVIKAGMLPDETEINKQLLKEVQDGEISPKALELLSRFVVVDLPQDYS